MLFKVKSVGRRLAAPARRRLDARESAHAQGPVSLVTCGGESGADGGRCGHGHWSVLTGLEAPLLQLDEARRLEQRVEQAHVGRAARPARYKRARCHAATGHARRAPLTWPPPLRANSVVAARSRDCATRPMSGRPAAT